MSKSIYKCIRCLWHQTDTQDLLVWTCAACGQNYELRELSATDTDFTQEIKINDSDVVLGGTEHG